LSISRVSVKVVAENMPELRAELIRFYAPMTVDEITRRLPLEGLIAFWENAIYITTEIERGAEKTTQKLNKGDIFYWPPGKILGIALEQHVPRTQTVKVGKAVDDVSVLKNARTGSKMRMVRE